MSGPENRCYHGDEDPGGGAAKGPPRRTPCLALPFLPQKPSGIPDVKGATPARGSIRCPSSSAQGPLQTTRGPLSRPDPRQERAFPSGEKRVPPGPVSATWTVVTSLVCGHG